MESETIHKFHSKRTFQYITVHKKKHSSQDVIVPGILRYGKCFTEPLIPPVIPGSDEKATPANSVDIIKEVDPIFRKDCESWTIMNIHTHKKDY